MYQSRYIAYCNSHGKTPEQMLAFDDERFPGGKMAGFITWIPQQWNAWAEERGHMPALKCQEHHDEFDAWLAAKYSRSSGREMLAVEVEFGCAPASRKTHAETPAQTFRRSENRNAIPRYHG